ncbi:MAG TPA: DinB family protein [Bryobacteraceae bacterium]
MAAKLDERLRETIRGEGSGLRAITEQNARGRSGGGEGWSRKQELGHLIDSATNNRVRFVVAALNGKYTGPTYDGHGWVELGGYAEAAWSDLVELWTRANEALARVIERVPKEQLAAPCKVGDDASVSLEFLIEDYIRHMKHHLGHILAGE